MRNTWCSGNAAETASLIFAELAKSVPSGFSRLMRTLSPARPAAETNVEEIGQWMSGLWEADDYASPAAPVSQKEAPRAPQA